ncbi:hypothetical protein EVAR_5635_1 [Eumeta japonica]|uniref:Uncharacterized protein n=1 Tax=Eumeta variegata TaxID=151549 RepID=A0A4C1TA70_EUMVA|nr:hypothetical protein EVAR_5635_1 [Eumeta japonica]
MHKSSPLPWCGVEAVRLLSSMRQRPDLACSPKYDESDYRFYLNLRIHQLACDKYTNQLTLQKGNICRPNHRARVARAQEKIQLKKNQKCKLPPTVIIAGAAHCARTTAPGCCVEFDKLKPDILKRKGTWAPIRDERLEKAIRELFTISLIPKTHVLPLNGFLRKDLSPTLGPDSGRARDSNTGPVLDLHICTYRLASTSRYRKVPTGVHELKLALQTAPDWRAAAVAGGACAGVWVTCEAGHTCLYVNNV